MVWDGGVKAEVPLPIAGIMSDRPLLEVNEALEAAKATAHALGVSQDIDPFMTLSFMALPVIPSLRVTTRGVFRRYQPELHISTENKKGGFPIPVLSLYSLFTICLL